MHTPYEQTNDLQKQIIYANALLIQDVGILFHSKQCGGCIFCVFNYQEFTKQSKWNIYTKTNLNFVFILNLGNNIDYLVIILQIIQVYNLKNISEQFLRNKTKRKKMFQSHEQPNK